MKILTLISLLIISSISHSQGDMRGEINPDEKEVIDAQKCRDAKFRMIPDCNGHVYFNEDNQATINQKSGKPYTGVCKVCHINGNLEMLLTFSAGKSAGIDTVWFDNGVANLIRGHTEDGSGLEDGIWKLYRPDGSLKWEKNYVLGAEDGESHYYFRDSSLHKIESWSMGTLNGKKQEFYPNNSLKKEIMYKDGEWNGKYITYFRDGMVESEQEFKMGKKEGLSRYYYEGGTLLYEESHDNGCRDGETRRFYPTDERKWTVENYKGDTRNGIFEEYYDNEKNTKKYSSVFKKGRLSEEHFYDEFGEESEAPEKKPFQTKDEQADDVKWPELPTQDWLDERKITRKKYDKRRKSYFKYKAKQQSNTNKASKC
ncbi:MAG: antitoxin component YwqK of YwqJK toxin-antitoxin module [Arenicella sp.]|jgi:antitoxin component YwqK of YwqJK toxin-antitoxin module